MRRNIFITCLALIAIVALAFAASREPHAFTANECIYCHIDVKTAPRKINSDITGACQTCHTEYAKTLSHPTSIYPTIHIPEDMPLTEGRLTCITCHYVHPDKKQISIKKHYFLRRKVSGIVFCSACHKIDDKRHIVFENVHKGEYEVTDRSTRIDRMSLECITCHDRYMEEAGSELGAGNWKHFKKEFNHPIGAEYSRISMKKMRNFRPAAMLRSEIKLFDGKMGCGTCHNIYSKERAMLVISNRNSRLCLECHEK